MCYWCYGLNSKNTHFKECVWYKNRKNAGAQKYRKAGWIPFWNVPMHVMGWRQCLFLERMILETPVAKTMVSNVNVFVKTAQTLMELATRLIITAIVCTNTPSLVSAHFKMYLGSIYANFKVFSYVLGIIYELGIII